MKDILTVLSGDIVVGTANTDPDLDVLHTVLAEAAHTISGWHGTETRYSRFGDTGWQICLPRTPSGLREALLMRAALRSHGRHLDTAVAVATGAARLPLSSDLRNAYGAAFLSSFGILDRVHGAHFAHGDGSEIAAVARLLDHVSTRWTMAQARAVFPMLAPTPPTHTQVADRLGITRQAVRQALIGAGFPALSDALTQLDASRQRRTSAAA